MNRKTKQWLGLVLVLIVAVSLLAGCRMHSMGAATHEAKMALAMRYVDGVLDDINATDAQKQNVYAAIDNLHGELLLFHEKCKQSHQILLVQFRGDRPDVTAINELVDQRLQEFNGLVRLAVDTVVQLHGQFTPEQREQLATMAEDHLSDN